MSLKSKIYLVVGLGNPGKAYQGTRHNIGFLLIDELAKSLGLKNKKFSKNFKAEFIKACYKKNQIILAKPQTFMNLSGMAVLDLVNFFKVPLENLIVIHDDLDLNFGKLKIKFSGGTAGHQGLNSIVEKINSKDFLRVRLGIGRGEKGKEKDYVLEKFSYEQKKILKEFLKKAKEAVFTIIELGHLKAMNFYNR